MKNAIKVEIKRLSSRAFAKIEREQATEEKYRRKFNKRTGQTAGVPAARVATPAGRHFDPRYCARNANFLSKSIWHKVIEGRYETAPAIRYLIPKPDGTKREIMAFSIPDAALANVVLRRTMARNAKRLSPSSYAYHPDKNVFDAILALREFNNDGKLFAVQIDFEKYFDLIPTGYLKTRINNAEQISLTPHERHIFDRFLHHRYAQYDVYGAGDFKRRNIGTPQGSSVSLLLANLANHDLDIALSEKAGKFVRFADDVVALCNTYEQSQELERCFYEHCRNSGLKINAQKSPGIGIIAARENEIKTYKNFDYLGYRFDPKGLGVPAKVSSRIKTRISRLVNIYLFQYLRIGFNQERSSTAPHTYDWDLLGLIYELRRSLYGGLSEADLSRFIEDGDQLRNVKGLMGFYCLLDNPEELRRLDGWMLSIVRRAMVKRNERLAADFACSCPTPTNADLATGAWLDPAAWPDEPDLEPRMPSLVRGWRAARKHYFTFGLENVQPPTYMFYSDVASLFDY